MSKPAPGRSSAPTRKTPAHPNKVSHEDLPKAQPQSKVPSTRQHGYVVMVNPREGYGFIRPNGAREGERGVHFNLRQVEGHRRVRAGQAVSYYLTRTDRGLSAIQVQPGSILSIPYLRFLLVGLASALLLLAGLTVVFAQPASLPLWLALWVAAFSIATYGVYTYDKMQSQAGRLRVPEAVLHLMGGLGGTPGAFVAIRLLPHKIRDVRFQAIFWLIAAAQVALVIWYFLLR